MRKALIALPLAVLTMIGLAGCTAVEVPDKPQATVILTPQTDKDSPATTDTPSAPPAEVQPGQPTQASSVPAESAEQTQKTGTTLDLEADGVEGTVYLQAVQDFSPYLNEFIVDGDTILYKRFNCLGKQAEHSGTLNNWGGEGKWVEWGSSVSADAMAPSTGGTVITATTMDTTSITISQINEATTEADAQTRHLRAMCLETGDTILNVVF